MVKLYTKQKIFILITSLLVAIISLFPFVNAHAAEKKSNKVADEQLWAVPEGGWSYIKYEVSYTEEYTYNTQTGLNEFFPREKRRCRSMHRRPLFTQIPVFWSS